MPKPKRLRLPTLKQIAGERPRCQYCGKRVEAGDVHRRSGWPHQRASHDRRAAPDAAAQAHLPVDRGRSHSAATGPSVSSG